MTDKKWLETVDRIMPCIEELLKVSEEFDIRLSIITGCDHLKAMVDYCKRDSIDTVHKLNIYNEGYAEVRNVQSGMVLKRIDMKSPDHCLTAGSGPNK